MTTTIEIKGLDRLLRDLDPIKARRGMTTAMHGAVRIVQKDLKEYPPKSEANQPRTFNSAYSLTGARGSMRSRRVIARAANSWYQRGYGPKWARKDGTIGGRMTSEKLGSQWNVKVGGTGRVIEGIVGNRASYGPAVQDRERQAWYHARRKWPTVQGVLEKRTKDIMKHFETAVRRLWGVK